MIKILLISSASAWVVIDHLSFFLANPGDMSQWEEPLPRHWRCRLLSDQTASLTESSAADFFFWQRVEQYWTLSQFLAHDFRQVIHRPQVLQSFRGRAALLPLKPVALLEVFDMMASSQPKRGHLVL